METKARHERLLKLNENQKEEIWRFEDEESDEEFANKLRELLGPQVVGKTRPK